MAITDDRGRSRNRILADLVASLSTTNVTNENDNHVVNIGDSENDLVVNSQIIELGRLSDGRVAFTVDGINDIVNINSPMFVDDALTFRWIQGGDDSDLYLYEKPTNIGTDDSELWRSRQELITLRSDSDFLTDFADLVIKSFKRHSFNERDFKDDNYNSKTKELLDDTSVRYHRDVSSTVDALIGHTLVWNGAEWEPGIPPSAEIAENTLDIQSVQVTRDDTTIIGFSERLGNYPLMFINGHILARTSETTLLVSQTSNPAISGTGLDYRVHDNLLISRFDADDVQILSGTADAIEFFQEVNANDEITTVSPFLENQARFHTAFVAHDVNGYDLEGPVYSHGVTGPSDSEVTVLPIYNINAKESDIAQRVTARAGYLMVFQNGMLMAQSGTILPSVSGRIEPDSDYELVVDSDTTIGTHVDIHWTNPIAVRDDNDFEFAWLQSFTETTPYNVVHWGRMIDSDDPLITDGVASIPTLRQALSAGGDPESSLIFLNGHLLAQSPVREYIITNDELTISNGLIPGDRIQVVTVVGTVQRQNLGDVAFNVDAIVDFDVVTEGDVLQWSPTTSRWTRSSSRDINTTVTPIAWCKFDYDSDTSSIVNLRTYNMLAPVITGTGNRECDIQIDPEVYTHFGDSDLMIQVTASTGVDRRGYNAVGAHTDTALMNRTISIEAQEPITSLHIAVWASQV